MHLPLLKRRQISWTWAGGLVCCRWVGGGILSGRGTSQSMGGLGCGDSELLYDHLVSKTSTRPRSVVIQWMLHYRRSGFECEILLIANYVFLHKTHQKNHRKKKTQWILHVTTPLLRACSLAIPNVHALTALSISRVLNLLACLYVQLSIVEDEYSSILQANCQPANTIANVKPSITVARAVYSILLIAHPTCSLTSHTSIAKIEGVAFSFGHSQSLEWQSGLYVYTCSYSTIRNRLTTHSKPDLQYIDGVRDGPIQVFLGQGLPPYCLS